jgi:hypothetical protein
MIPKFAIFFISFGNYFIIIFFKICYENSLLILEEYQNVPFLPIIQLDLENVVGQINSMSKNVDGWKCQFDVTFSTMLDITKNSEENVDSITGLALGPTKITVSIKLAFMFDQKK